ncbi:MULTISPECIES: hypothetical protein [unclassified Micromonospora]|uniref:hypothetical protein n=1 Tax=unclassified Micromonospora TaxID=2617518 RepID=UPI001C227A56|nr:MULTISPECIES: hypothetical protein [unclassified Micromonospora]MBU8859862.1 hypothetical protein [Micromonospora sp. WMMB482]MDM4779386.1 hypothetical protein [Micromonospora sp. b486]
MDAPGLDQETVERLLAGRSGDRSSAPPGLVAVLAAVRTAAGTGELDGEAAAVAAFREARRARRHRRVRFGVRVAVAALAASLTGGVALAATGNLPHAARPAAPPVTASPTPSARPSPPAGSPAPRTPHPSSPPGLCLAYRAVAEPQRGRALSTPAFSDLVAAAGGRDRVPDYCAGLLGGDPPGKADGTRRGGRTEHPARPSGGPPGGTPPGNAEPQSGSPPGRRTA